MPDAEALNETQGLMPGSVVPLKHRHLQHVLLHVGLHPAVSGGQGDEALPVSRAAADHLDGPDLHRPVPGGGHSEGGRGDGGLHMHGAQGLFRVGIGRQPGQQPAVFGHDPAVDDCPQDPEVLQILEEHQIGALARGDGAQILVHLEALGAVERDHLDGGHRRDALFHRPAQQPVHMALGQ